MGNIVWRCKLEYLYKRFEGRDRKRVIYYLAPNEWGSSSMFHRMYYPFLENPNSLDDDVLLSAGIGSARFYTEERLKELVELKKNEYRRVFREINELCKKYNTKKFFTNPEDIALSEKERRALIAEHPEEKLNEFFGVKWIGDYQPPEYEE